MSKKPYLWKNRPLTEKLIYYAGCDVKYLPKVYDIICNRCDKGFYHNVKMENIFNECNKYLKYLEINKDVKNFNRSDLAKGKKLSGLIKNFQHKCVFVQLNIGYMGIVTSTESVSTLKEKYKLENQGILNNDKTIRNTRNSLNPKSNKKRKKLLEESNLTSRKVEHNISISAT